MKTIPALDVFAGPGGLSEGFSRYVGQNLRFRIELSIEKDPVACRTLRLRAFVRQFAGRDLPEALYDYIRGDSSKLDLLHAMPEWEAAEAHVRQWTLGAPAGSAGHVSTEVLHETIDAALPDSDEWLLLGGPPCQAYSLIGRARMTGVGAKIREANDPRRAAKSRRQRESAFADDHRHTLYREYLRIVAVHQPAAFVMENVKGILSARIAIAFDEDGHPTQYAKVFDQIQRDLQNPWEALTDDPDVELLRKLNITFRRGAHRYRLFSFVRTAAEGWAGLSNDDFVIQSEDFSVPQTRHRVILLGIREDLATTHVPLKLANDQVTVRDVLRGMPPLRSGLSSDNKTVKAYGCDSQDSWLNALYVGASKLVAHGEPALGRRAMKSVVAAKSLSSRGGTFVPCNSSLDGVLGPLRQFVEDRRLGGVIQHQTRSHMASDLMRYLYLATSSDKPSPQDQVTPTLRTWPKFLLPVHANVRHEKGERIVEGFVDRFRVQVWDRSSSTVTSHISKDGHYFIHPDPRQCRSLTVREAARLQTFPENYFFEGNRTEQFIQVGNAVPPFLALQLAASVASLFQPAAP